MVKLREHHRYVFDSIKTSIIAKLDIEDRLRLEDALNRLGFGKTGRVRVDKALTDMTTAMIRSQIALDNATKGKVKV